MLFGSRNYQTTAACFSQDFCQETEFLPELNKALLTPRTLFLCLRTGLSILYQPFIEVLIYETSRLTGWWTDVLSQ